LLALFCFVALSCLPAAVSSAAWAGMARASDRVAQRRLLVIGFMVSLLAANTLQELTGEIAS
jgi:hypothetical protein